MIPALLNIVVGVLLVLGSLFALVAALGILRLPDVYTRMQGAAKAGTLGSMVCLVAIALYAEDLTVTARALLGILFFLLTSPVSTHLLARAARLTGQRPIAPGGLDAMEGLDVESGNGAADGKDDGKA